MKRLVLIFVCFSFGVLGAITYFRLAKPTTQTLAAPVPAFQSRKYYLSKNEVTGALAKTACTTGYHMASIFEIRDTSVLQYDVINGLVAADSGIGPPLLNGNGHAGGWVRTGGGSVSGGFFSYNNCSAWTSSDPSQHGSSIGLTAAALPNSPTWSWIEGTSNLGRSCEQATAVWCVQD
jgi:hypothetical protein